MLCLVGMRQACCCLCAPLTLWVVICPCACYQVPVQIGPHTHMLSRSVHVPATRLSQATWNARSHRVHMLLAHRSHEAQRGVQWFDGWDAWGCSYVGEEGVVTLKGQVAAEIQSADELVLCELVFQGGLQVRGCCHMMSDWS